MTKNLRLLDMLSEHQQLAARLEHFQLAPVPHLVDAKRLAFALIPQPDVKRAI